MQAEEVSLPEKADIIISEPMGTLLLNERMVESFVVGRDRFMKHNEQGVAGASARLIMHLGSSDTCVGVFLRRKTHRQDVSVKINRLSFPFQ
eukprot:COSAG05_NODE_1290_length_5264_cov_2884.921394_3_plen_92_part_00